MSKQKMNKVQAVSYEVEKKEETDTEIRKVTHLHTRSEEDEEETCTYKVEYA